VNITPFQGRLRDFDLFEFFDPMGSALVISVKAIAQNNN
jgi:hypothetical protein